METNLHRQLKQLYAASARQIEVRMQGYIIDAISDQGELIEVQHAPLGSIKNKCQDLLRNHQLRIVKPVVHRKWIVGLKCKEGPVERRRLSPKRGSILDVFAELTRFIPVFPHPRLTIEIPFIDAEEWRYPIVRRWGKQFRVQDQCLVDVHQSIRLSNADDLLTLLNTQSLPEVFHSQDLAQSAGCPRWLAQKIAYCLRRVEAADVVGKQGNSLLYRLRSSAA
jgi:hypothetical protein